MVMGSGYLQAQDSKQSNYLIADLNLAFEIEPTVVAIDADACGDFSNSDNPSFFVASQNIRTGNACESGFTTVNSEGELMLKAGQSISLNPGFSAQPGSHLHAFVGTPTFSELVDPKGAGFGTVASEALELNIQPNPFQGFTTLGFNLSADADVDLAIFDANGKLVRIVMKDEPHKQGPQSFNLNCNGLSPGIYFCRLKAGNSVCTSKLVIIG